MSERLAKNRRGSDKMCLVDSYNSGRKLDAFLSFIREKLEADKGFGRLDVLDTIVQNFLTGMDVFISRPAGSLRCR